MSKIIASGKIIENEDLVVTATVAEEIAKSEESASSSGEASYIVYLTAKQFNAAELPVNPLTYADIAELVEAESGAAMEVPTLDKKSTVALDAPVAIKYAKTKAFEYANKICVFTTLRYTF